MKQNLLLIVAEPIIYSNANGTDIRDRISIYGSRYEIPNNVVCSTSKASDQPAHTPSLIRVFASRLNML